MAEFKHIVRIKNTDLKGNVPIGHALTQIKGIGSRFANCVCNHLNIDKTTKAGELEDKDIKSIAALLEDPVSGGIPVWMLNRRMDYDSGDDKHLMSADLGFVQDNDVRRLKRTKSYRGLRHAWGLPTRGQRTKANFRRNKGKVQGVKRKSKK